MNFLNLKQRERQAENIKQLAEVLNDETMKEITGQTDEEDSKEQLKREKKLLKHLRDVARGKK